MTISRASFGEVCAERDHYRSAYEGLVGTVRVCLQRVDGARILEWGDDLEAEVFEATDVLRAALPDPKEEE